MICFFCLRALFFGNVTCTKRLITFPPSPPMRTRQSKISLTKHLVSCNASLPVAILRGMIGKVSVSRKLKGFFARLGFSSWSGGAGLGPCRAPASRRGWTRTAWTTSVRPTRGRGGRCARRCAPPNAPTWTRPSTTRYERWPHPPPRVVFFKIIADDQR